MTHLLLLRSRGAFVAPALTRRDAYVSPLRTLLLTSLTSVIARGARALTLIVKDCHTEA